MEMICKELQKKGVDSWIVYDYGSNNPVFKELVGNYHLTRKCFLVIKSSGESVLILHSIDSGVVEQKGLAYEASILKYNRWVELIELLKDIIKPGSRVLMEISENGLLPRVSYVDYGTVKLIESFGCFVESSADIFQMIVSKMSQKSYELHCKAALTVTKIKDETFEFIFSSISQNGKISEYEAQQYIMKRFKEEGMITDSPPIVAIAENAANPHYEPSLNDTAFIHKGDLILMDLWAKYDVEDAVFGDITWMGYVGEDIPQRYQDVFDLVKRAADSAIHYLEENITKKRVMGFEVDDVCRAVIEDEGFGKYFTHRTGHSLSVGDSDHGTGANIDNYETHDTRELIDGVGFSIEPGIYIPGELGVREESNVCIWNNKVVVTTPRQDTILRPSDYNIIL